MMDSSMNPVTKEEDEQLTEVQRGIQSLIDKYHFQNYYSVERKGRKLILIGQHIIDSASLQSVLNLLSGELVAYISVAKDGNPQLVIKFKF